jgi:hypothetical protein
MALAVLIRRIPDYLSLFLQPTFMKLFGSALKHLSIGGALLCLASTAMAQNNVVDGGFEMSPSPNFSSAWTLNPAAGSGAGQQFSNVGNDPAFAHSGNRYANLAPAFQQTGSLSQVLNTVAGATYSLSFWLANNSSMPTNFFQALVNGAVRFTTTSPPFPITGQYQLITISGITATGPTTTLEFRYRHDDDFWRLDDVAFVGPAGTSVPEGGVGLWLLVPLVAGLCFVHFRLRARAAGVS